jgi:hypothetical protein
MSGPAPVGASRTHLPLPTGLSTDTLPQPSGQPASVLNSPARPSGHSSEHPLHPSSTGSRPDAPTMSAAQQKQRRTSLPKSASSDSLAGKRAAKTEDKPASSVEEEARAKRPDEPRATTLTKTDAEAETEAPITLGTTPVVGTDASPSGTIPAAPPGMAPIFGMRLPSAADLAAHQCNTAREALTYLYAPLKAAGRDAAAVDAFVARQAAVLEAHGIQTKAQLDATYRKAALLSLFVHKPIEGAVGSTFFNAADAGFGFGAPFGALGSPKEGADKLAKVGLISSALDVANSPVKDLLTKDRVYTNPSQGVLDPVMQNVNPKGAVQQGTNRALGASAGFSGRNAVRLAVEGIMISEKVPAKVRGQVQQYMSTLGGFPAAMVMAMTVHLRELKQGHAGPAQFFGRTDLDDTLTRLNKPLGPQIKDAVGGLLSATGVGPLVTRGDAEQLKNGLMALLKGAGELAWDVAKAEISPAGLASHVVLTPFFSAVGALAGSAGHIREAVAEHVTKKHPTMPADKLKDLIDNQAGVITMVAMFVMLAAAYAAWGYSPEAGQKLKDLIFGDSGPELHATLTEVDNDHAPADNGGTVPMQEFAATGSHPQVDVV